MQGVGGGLFMIRCIIKSDEFFYLLWHYAALLKTSKCKMHTAIACFDAIFESPVISPPRYKPSVYKPS